MEHRHGISREQISLFPESIDDLISANHPIRVIDLYVNQLDLQQLGFGKVQVAAKGRPPYHPGDLLKLYLYGYLNRVRSSRRLEAECHRNVEVMWLLKRLQPDHKTIANFRKDESEALQATCRNFVQLCRRAGLISGDMVAIDGSKFQAVASKDKAFSESDLKRQEAALTARIQSYLAQLDEADRGEGEGIDRGAVQALLSELKAQQQTINDKRAAIEGTRRTKQIEGEPDARLVKDRHRSFAGYNLQSAVDSQHKLIVYHDVVSDGNDLRQLLPMAQQTKEVLQQDQLTIVADAGYSNGEHLSGCEAQGITPYVALARACNNQGDGKLFDRTMFTYNPASDNFTCPADETLIRKQRHNADRITIYEGTTCGQCKLKSQCTTAKQRFVSRHFDEDTFKRVEQRLADRPDIMRLRSATVEHPFGNLKRWIFGDGRFLVRGIQKVKGETAVAILAYNLRRTLNIGAWEAIRRVIAA